MQRKAPDGSRSFFRFLVPVRRHSETISPFVHAAGRNGDGVFSAAIVVAKLAVTDVAEDCSFIQARPTGDLSWLE